MKNTFRPIFLLAAVTLAANLFFGSSPVSAEKASAGSTVRAYYFHGTFRCLTCNKMEKYSRETIETNFKTELDSGKLAFKSINVESKDNKHFVTDYQLYTKALILSMEENGKEVRHKNLDKIWDYVGNKEQFENYVRDEVGAFMKEM